MKKTYVFFFLFIVFYSCNKDAVKNFGPFDPVDDIENVIILGNNGQFEAFNVRTLEAVQTYDLPTSYADCYTYLNGHLIIMVMGGGRFNINVETGEVEKHKLPTNVQWLENFENDSLIEAFMHGGYTTMHYNVFTNEVVDTFLHTMQCAPTSATVFHNGIYYWFLDSFEHNENYEFITNSKGDSLKYGNNNELVKHRYVDNGYVVRRELFEEHGYENALSTLEKIINIYPLETELVWTYPEDAEDGISSVLPYNNKLLAFTPSKQYLLDSKGEIVYAWAEDESEKFDGTDHYAIRSKMAKLIKDDKLYTYGKIYKDSIKTHVNCCVQINLETGEEEWIEVWRGW